MSFDLCNFLMQKYLFQSPRSLREIQNIKKAYRDAFYSCCLELKPDIILEIGAHEADFSRKIKKELPACKSIAFEANPYIHTFFTEKFDFGSLGVSYRNMIVSDICGMREFNAPFVPPTGCMGAPKGIGSILHMNSSSEQFKKVSVESTTLDTVAKEFPNARIIAMHIDVEGASREVLQGGETLFISGRVAIVNIEMNNVELWQNQWLDRDIYSFLSSYGFELAFTNFEATQKYDACFIHKNIITPTPNPIFRIVDEYFQRLQIAKAHFQMNGLYNALVLRGAARVCAHGATFDLYRHNSDGVFFCAVFRTREMPREIHYEMRIEKYDLDHIHFCLHFEVKDFETREALLSKLAPFYKSACDRIKELIDNVDETNDKYGYRLTTLYSLSCVDIYINILKIMLDETSTTMLECAEKYKLEINSENQAEK